MKPKRGTAGAVVRAAMRGQWDMLAIWIKQGRPFVPSAQKLIVRDIMELHKACARHAAATRKKGGRNE